MIAPRKYRPGSVVRLPFNAFSSDDPAASVTVAGLDTAAVQVYKDAGLAQRTSDAGESVVVDFDGIVGRHYVSVDTSDPLTPGFFTGGGHFDVAIDGLTIDGGAINVWAGSFSLGHEGSILDTYISAITSQTRFEIPVGPATADAFNGCPVLFFAEGSAFEFKEGYIRDYSVATGLECILGADPGGFTIGVNDSVSILPQASVGAINGVLATLLEFAMLGGSVGRVEDVTAEGEFQIRALDGSLLPADGFVGQALGFLRFQADGTTLCANPHAKRVVLTYDDTTGDATFGFANDTLPTQHPFNNLPVVGDLWMIP